MHRLFVAQMDLVEYRQYFTIREPGIWWAKVFMSEAEILSSPITTVLGASFENLYEEPVNIGSVVIGTRQLVRTESLTSLQTQDGAFWFDVDNQEINVRFTDGIQYYIEDTIKLGKSFTMASHAQYDGIKWVDKIGPLDTDVVLDIESVNDEQIVNELGNNEMSFDSFDFSFTNPDGRFDDIRQKINGQGARLMFAEQEDIVDFSDLKIIRFGFVNDVSFTSNSVNVSVGDPRASWNMKINTETFNSTDYPSINDRYIDKKIPLAIGDVPVYDIPLIPVSSTTFVVSSVAYGSTGTLIELRDKEGAIVSAGDYAYDQNTGILTFSTYDPDVDGDLTCDLNPVDKGNIAEMIVWLIAEFAGILFIDANYNLTEVNDVISRSASGSMYFGTKGVVLKKAIDKLSSSINARIYPQNDKYTMRDLTKRTPVVEIKDDQLVSIPAPWRFQMDSYFSSITCSYKERYNSGDFDTLFDNSREVEATNNNVIFKPEEAEVALVTESDAQDWIDARYERAVLVPKVIDLQLCEHVDVELLDYVVFTHNRLGVGAIAPRANYEIIKLSKASKTMSIKYVEDNPLDEELTLILDFMNTGQTDILDFQNTGQALFLDFDPEGEAS